jgi:uncharacterized membrane protein YqjE
MSNEEKLESKGGLIASLKKLSATLIAIGQTRLDLLATEIEEERERLFSILIWTCITLFFAALAVIIASLLIVVYYWETYRLISISTLLLIFITAAGFAWKVVCKMSKDKPRIFSATLAELSKDHEQLSTRNEQ